MAINPVQTSDAATHALQQAQKSSHTQPQAKPAAAQSNAQPAPQTQHAQAPKPVINGQGQTTGQILNATA